MKKLLFLLAFSATLFTSCLKDTCDEVNVYTMYEPVYKNLDEIRSVSADAPQELINPGQIYIYKNYLFINEFRKGIHIFDNSNPSKPINLAFYSIPGNAQLSIKDDLLYVNNFLDLLTINIADPLNIKVVDVEEFIFMEPNLLSIMSPPRLPKKWNVARIIIAIIIKMEQKYLLM